MTAGRLAGKVAIVTGGARGQGAAEGRLFVEEGATVYLTDLLVDEGEKTAHPGRAHGDERSACDANHARDLSPTGSATHSRTVSRVRKERSASTRLVARIAAPTAT